MSSDGGSPSCEQSDKAVSNEASTETTNTQEHSSEDTSNVQTSNDQDNNIAKLTALPSDKIRVLLKPAGSTPALTRNKWNVTRDKTIGSIATFVKKPLKMETQQTLFLYVKQTFAPSPDVQVGQLYDCFGSDGQLVLHYCATEAWG